MRVGIGSEKAKSPVRATIAPTVARSGRKSPVSATSGHICSGFGTSRIGFTSEFKLGLNNVGRLKRGRRRAGWHQDGDMWASVSRTFGYAARRGRGLSVGSPATVSLILAVDGFRC